MLREFETAAPADVEAVLRYVEHAFARSSRSLAAFSCAADGYLRIFPLAVPIRSRARRMDLPYLKPLANLIDLYGHYGVAVVDQLGARLFYFHLGELREREGILGETVRHTKRGGASTFPGRRGGIAGQTQHTEEVTDRNLREAARAAAAFFEENHVRRVLIGGSHANVKRFQSFLPKSWQSLIVGTFPMDMDANSAQVRERALALAQKAEVEAEESLVERLLTAAAKGREGVVRLDPTLHAVRAGQVQTLVLRDGFRAPGFRCRGCEYLTAQRPVGGCPFCGNEFDEIEDAVELAVRQVMSAGGEVEVLGDHTAFERAGSIGALLRY
jgi:peptide subunit release factor 1 (eRF1)